MLPVPPARGKGGRVTPVKGGVITFLNVSYQEGAWKPDCLQGLVMYVTSNIEGGWKGECLQGRVTYVTSNMRGGWKCDCLQRRVLRQR